MTFKAIVPQPISKAIGAFRIDREIKIRLLAAIHDDLPRHADEFRLFRSRADDRFFHYKAAIEEAGIEHTFFLEIDDSASGYLIVASIRYVRIQSL